MKTRLLSLVLVLMSSLWSLSAQQMKSAPISPWSIDLELASRYIWRGLEYGDAATFFPKIAYTHGNLQVYALGSTGIDGSYKEANLGLKYRLSRFTFALVDSYSPTHWGKKDTYLDLKPQSTRHALDMRVLYEPESLPLSFFGSCFFYGNDRLEDGRQAYSTYFELSYYKSFSPEQHLSLSLGATPFKSFYTDYRSGAAWVNLTLQYRVDFKLGSLALPMSVSYTLNPQREKSYVYLSITLRS